ncbi:MULTISPECIES: hypothetical protein [unclassified Nostoc]|uniref:hypothetical protein n=1 Tax=unclassified Nostoc TaxID=2593658 RepID=UPI0025E747D7|nr:hypothetical protein [Nostoc sp. JL33]MBN3868960.1 hypothetical protein [Nostoc sp. JL33]
MNFFDLLSQFSRASAIVSLRFLSLRVATTTTYNSDVYDGLRHHQRLIAIVSDEIH